ncbi:hypothetical protein L484_012477 [Morus notabilis]|uniref:Uncharacterized protein n=1 Tax=Morus notabilis TaxID=981085 RepID=W9RP87_9ROSA|nr:hypothetical protein L484_012477 [Morus notabilis]
MSHKHTESSLIDAGNNVIPLPSSSSREEDTIYCLYESVVYNHHQRVFPYKPPIWTFLLHHNTSMSFEIGIRSSPPKPSVK